MQFPRKITIKDPLIELHNVVDADSSQIDAIIKAKSGESFVLQGPPGTGKSQTITNIIAECLSDGKKILFVSEKLAALNVVYEKLKKAGLSEFCLQLHSHKSNKKDVIEDIFHTLHLEKSVVSSKADCEIALKERALRQLDAYAIELHKQIPIIEKSLYQLYEDYSSVYLKPNVEYIIPQLSTKGETYLTEATYLLEQYIAYIPTIGYDYKTNPWYKYVNQDISLHTESEVKRNLSLVIEFLQKLIPLLQEISIKYEIHCESIDDARFWGDFFGFLGKSELITPYLLNRDTFNNTKIILHDLQSKSSDILANSYILNQTFNNNIYQLDWKAYYNKLQQFNGKIFKRFNDEYKHLINDLCLCKKDGKAPSYQDAIIMTEQLSNYQEKNREYNELEATIKAFLGTAYKGIETKWDYIFANISKLEYFLSSNISFGSLECYEYEKFLSEMAVFTEYSQKIAEAFAICDDNTLRCVAEYFGNTIYNIKSANCIQVFTKLKDCLESMDKLNNWCHFRNLLSNLESKQIVPYIDIAINQNIEPKNIVGAFKKQFYYQWIDSILSGNPVLQSFDRVAQDKAVNNFIKKDIEQFEINKAKIRAELSSMRPSLDMVAPNSALSILIREGEKKRKQKGIRTILVEAGELVQRIKPCFLMSPLSVSTFLAPGSVDFDVVIFDEASQIFPQDAIGAIYRGKQLIMVGDSKQMPPSNFFNASMDRTDSDDEAEDITDYESILDLCSTSMQQLRLRWHYRSRYEQLITFSNKNFYDSDLITFPSSKANASGIGIDYFYVDGLFDRKSHSNRKEAEFIVDQIYRNIEKYPKRSLGVVAFSISQQDLIDKILFKRRQTAPEQEWFFSKDRNEPFFIKNLETVQGDERDTIIFSVAYGADSQGRLLYNFGPLSRDGGERRLNVAITRAKYNVQVVSSMHCKDIDLKSISSRGAKLLHDYLDYAENGEIAIDRAISVSQFEKYDSDFELEVCDYLRSKGFSVDTQIGCSGFRIDLGLKIPNSSDYVLAIECDGASYHSSKNARDRDRLRQQILEGMGWQFYRIWSTDWLRNKTVEQQRLLEAVNEALNNHTKELVEHIDDMPVETFEETVDEQYAKLTPYRVADIPSLIRQYPRDLKGLIKEILEIEAPLSEELLLRRIVSFFGNREKVTTVVQRQYDQLMFGCHDYGIIRKKGFLYLDGKEKFQLRGPGDIKREITQISPEELAAGMLDILKENMIVDRGGLYNCLAKQCGVTRVGRSINEAMDSALNVIKDHIIINDEQISLKL